jgi:protein TonB
MKRYLIAKRWWGMARARWRARMWAFLLGPHIEAPPSDNRRTLRFGTRGVFVALAIAGSCHLASGLVLRIILGAWTAGEARAKHVRTVTVRLLPASAGAALDLPPSLAARPPDAPAPPVRVPQREPIPVAHEDPQREGRITPKPQPVAPAPATEDTVVTSTDGVGDANGGGEGMGTGGGTEGPPAGLGTDSFVAFDTPPQRLSEIEPEYPELAIEARSQGTVLVQVTIDETGKVIEAVVVRSDVIFSLEQAALKAAKATPFRPAKQRDVPVISRVVLPFRFQLKTEEGS